jgi:hypothetical protein
VDASLLLAALEAVLRIHYSRTRYLDIDGPGGTTLCGRCHEHWPCTEVAAISRALGAAETQIRGDTFEHDERCCMNGIAPGKGPHPDCPGVAALERDRGVPETQIRSDETEQP